MLKNKDNFVKQFIIICITCFFAYVLIVQAADVLDFINPGKEYIWQSASGFYFNRWSAVSKTYHTGIDLNQVMDSGKIVAIKNDVDKYGNVYAIADGKVSFSEDNARCEKGAEEKEECHLFGFGKHIGIRHTLDDGKIVESHYAHLNRRLVEKGDEVQKGDLIGIIGTTGASTGIHLHFEIRKIKKINAKVEPNLWPKIEWPKKKQQKWIGNNYYDPLLFIDIQHTRFVEAGSRKKVAKFASAPSATVTITKKQIAEDSPLSRLWNEINNFFGDIFSKIKITFLNINSQPVKRKRDEKEKNEEKQKETKRQIAPVWNARLVGQSDVKSLTAGKIAELWVKYQNNGNQDFTSKNISLNIYGNDTARFYHTSWLTQKRSTVIAPEAVEPNSAGEFRFQIQAPETAGDYKIAFRPVYRIGNDFEWLGEDIVCWKFEVTAPVAGNSSPEEDSAGEEKVVVKGVEYEEETQEEPGQGGGTGEDEYYSNGNSGGNGAKEKEKLSDTLNLTIANNQNSGRGGGAASFVSVDTAPPVTVIYVAPNNPTNQTTAQFAFVADKEAGYFECQIDKEERKKCVSPVEYTNLTDGEHIFNVRAVNLFVDNVETEPPNYTWTIDSTITSPTITLLSDQITNQNEIDIQIASDDEAIDWFISEVNQSPTPNDPNWLVSRPTKFELSTGDGEKTVYVWTKDGLDNISILGNFIIATLDTTPPIIKVANSSNLPTLTNLTNIEFEFSVDEKDAIIRCKLDDNDWQICDSPKSYNNLIDGDHSFSLKAIDSANNTSEIFTRNWTIDTTIPSSPIITLNNGEDFATNQTPQILTGTTENTTTVLINDSAAEINYNGSNPINWQKEVNLIEGENIFAVVADDNAGNKSGATNFVITLDTQAPATPTIIFPESLLFFTNQNNLTLTGRKANDVTRINVNLNGKEDFILADFLDEENWQYELKLTQEENIITLTGRDEAENISEPIILTVGFDTTPPEPPVITTENGENFTTGYPTIILEGVKQEDADFVFINSEPAEIIDSTDWQTVLNLESGENIFEIFAQDLAGNFSEATNLIITYDSSLLTIDLTQKPSALTNQIYATFAFSSGVEIDQFFCQLDEGTETECDSPKTYNSLSDDWHKFNLRASDSLIKPLEYQWYIDTIPPDDPEFILNNNEEWTDRLDIDVNIAPDEDVAFWLIAENSSIPEVDDEDWREEAPTNFVLSDFDGEKTIYLWVKDEAGNINVGTINRIVRLDRVKPTCAVAELESEQTTETFDLTINVDDDYSGAASWTVEYREYEDDWKIWVSDLTETTVEFTGGDGLEYGFRCRAADNAGNSSELGDADATTTINIPTYPDVVINEIAWMGTNASVKDEWIELYNNTDQDIDLTDWSLISTDGKPKIIFNDNESKIKVANSTIPAGGYYLLERNDNDTAISDISADLTYGNNGSSWALNNNGEYLRLKNSQSETVDEINNSNGWFAGDNDAKATMERIDSTVDGSEESNWQTNNRVTINGLDADGNPINGTPKRKNSASLELGPMTIIDSDIVEDAVWDPENNIYVVVGKINISGVQLTVNPGTIIKFMPNSQLSFDWSDLDAYGTEDNKIIFTSIYDDVYGGDTDGNGSQISPRPDDWGGIIFDSGFVNLQNTVIRYGKTMELYSSGMRVFNLEMTDVEMADNQSGVGIYGCSKVEISDSYLDNVDFNIYNIMYIDGDELIIEPIQNYLYDPVNSCVFQM